MPNRKSSKPQITKIAEATVSYALAVQPDENLNRSARVSVTVDSGLLSFIDDYVEQHPAVTRSAVFDQALEMWVLYTQQHNDLTCYSQSKTSKEISDWNKISTEAAKRIWP